MNNLITIFFFHLFILAAIPSTIGQTFSEKDYAPFNLPSQDYVASYDFADFNQDDKLDVVVASYTENKLLLTIKYNEGDSLQRSLGKIDSVFDFQHEIKNINNPIFLVASDIDGDGDSDFFLGEVAGSNIDASVGILENQSTNGDLSFEYKNTDQLTTEFVMAIPSVVDIDGDGLEDLIVSNLKGHLKIYKNNGNFQFSLMESMPLVGYEFSSSVSFSEISINGEEGILAYNYEKDFQFFRKHESRVGTFQLDTDTQILRNPDTLRTKFYQPRFNDIDNDGNKDLFLSALTFGESRGYYTDSWLFFNASFGAFATTTNIGCSSAQDGGAIHLTLNNGVSPYQYHWTNKNTLEEEEGSIEKEEESITNLLAGAYELIITDANGNSSSQDLEIQSARESVIKEVICHGEVFEGYAETGVYTDLFQSREGCDSTRIIELTILPSISESIIHLTTCEGDIQEVYTEQTIDTLSSISGCDSIVQTNVTIYPHRIRTQIDTSICVGASFEGRTEKGNYIDFFKSTTGCDSIRILNLELIDEDSPLCQTSNIFEINKTDDFKISPNPTKELIKITFENFDFLGSTLKLFSTNGELLTVESLDSYDKLLNLKGLPNGAYLLTIDSHNSRFIERIIKH